MKSRTAVLFLVTEGPIFLGSDIDRLQELRTAAQDEGYEITEARVVREETAATAAREIREMLRTGKTDAMVTWHLGLDRPDVITEVDAVPHGQGSDG